MLGYNCGHMETVLKMPLSCCPLGWTKSPPDFKEQSYFREVISYMNLSP